MFKTNFLSFDQKGFLHFYLSLSLKKKKKHQSYAEINMSKSSNDEEQCYQPNNANYDVINNGVLCKTKKIMPQVNVSKHLE